MIAAFLDCRGEYRGHWRDDRDGTPPPDWIGLAMLVAGLWFCAWCWWGVLTRAAGVTL